MISGEAGFEHRGLSNCRRDRAAVFSVCSRRVRQALNGTLRRPRALDVAAGGVGVKACLRSDVIGTARRQVAALPDVYGRGSFTA